MAGFSLLSREENRSFVRGLRPRRRSRRRACAFEKVLESELWGRLACRRIVAIRRASCGRELGGIGDRSKRWPLPGPHLHSGDERSALTALEFAVRHYARADREVTQLLRELRFKVGTEPGAVPISTVDVSVRGRRDGRSCSRQTSPSSSHAFPKPPRSSSGANPTRAFALRMRREAIPSSGCAGSRSVTPKSRDGRPDLEPAGAQWPPRGEEADGFSLSPASELGITSETLLEQTTKPLHVIEPLPELFASVLTARDCRPLLERLASLTVGSTVLPQTLVHPERRRLELLIYPQTQVVAGAAVQELRRGLVATRGLSELRPTIGVVGPLWGGSLPIARYTTHALQGLEQRVMGYDLSPFHRSFSHMGTMFKQASRRDSLESQYVELLSDIVLEGVTERPVDILICLAQAPLSPRVLTEMRNRGIVTAMWFVEDFRRFDSWKTLAPYFDFFFMIQRGRRYARWKPRVPAGGVSTGRMRSVDSPASRSPPPEERTPASVPTFHCGAGYNNRRLFAYSRGEFQDMGHGMADVRAFNELVQEGTAGRTGVK